MAAGKKDDDTPEDAPVADAHTLRPTVLPTPTGAARKPSHEGKRPAVSAPRSRTSTPSVKGPTAIPGVERRRIEVSSRDLKALSPGAAAEVHERAADLLRGLVVQQTSERKAILWGHEVQKSYGVLVAGTLALSQSPLLRKVEGYLTRMMDILGTIDVMAVCGHGGGGLGQLFKSVNTRIDSAEELGSAQAELDQLVGYLSTALHDLLDLRDQLEHHAAKVAQLALEVEASALAALFLSHHLQQQQPSVSQRFTDRSMSLTETLAQIHAGAPMRAMQIDHPIRVVGIVQRVVLVMMPGLLAGIASALVLLDRRGMTPTQAGELSYQLKHILQELHT